ncbi:MAG: hypothetical protein A4E69_01459 [Syntrophus sp. PtaB.Bin138]|nr:MAG: hypothetical protein A4E69_01459 [Syntrophus sp. PtaB.Bin138]
MLCERGIAQYGNDRALRVDRTALFKQEPQGFLVQGDDQIQFSSPKFSAENVSHFMPVFRSGVSRQVQELEIQVVEIETVCNKGFLKTGVDDLVGWLGISERMQYQNLLRGKVGLGKAGAAGSEDQEQQGKQECHCPGLSDDRNQGGPQCGSVPDDAYREGMI